MYKDTDELQITEESIHRSPETGKREMEEEEERTKQYICIQP